MNKKKLTLTTILILTFLAGGSFYSDRVSGESQATHQLETEKGKLEEEIKSLELVLSKQQSLENISRCAFDLGMTPQTDTWFIKPLESLSLR
ncbi:MAG: hypothetical protein ABH814_01460 [bacterium]